MRHTLLHRLLLCSFLVVFVAGCTPVIVREKPGTEGGTSAAGQAEEAIAALPPEVSAERILDRRSVKKDDAECEPIKFPEPLAVDEGWVNNQIIITGPDQGIDDVVSRAQELFSERSQPIELRSIGECPFTVAVDAGFRRALEQRLRRQQPLSEEPVQKFNLRLYEFSGELSELEVIETIEEAAIESKQFLFADRNYVTSGSHGVGCTKVGALTHSVGNGPFGDPQLTATATESEFMGQWAFDGLTGGAPITDVLKPDAGKDVLVGVFDSAPVDLDPTKLPFPLTFTLSVDAAEVVTPAAASPTDHLANQHGIFVSSLIKAIALGSDIYLYRTLDDHGCGTLQALEFALINFLQLGSGGKPMVVNLSLGIHVPQDAGEQWEEIVSLLFPTLDAYYSGATIFAANGNDSSQSVVFRPLRPAIYDYVLGVAATTQSGSRACYSNQGDSYLSGDTIYYYDIAAPGGEAGPATVDGENHSCAPLISQCPNQSDGDCSFGLLGRVEINGKPEKFAYWAGTSFATPLVSGVAAVCLAQASSAMSPSQVINLLRDAAIPHFSADLQSGILRLPASCRPPPQDE